GATLRANESNAINANSKMTGNVQKSCGRNWRGKQDLLRNDFDCGSAVYLTSTHYTHGFSKIKLRLPLPVTRGEGLQRLHLNIRVCINADLPRDLQGIFDNLRRF